MSVPAKRDDPHYFSTFRHRKAATVSPPDYLTYELRETVLECQEACNEVVGCNFGGSPLLTCALFKECHDASSATNSGQTQPDGSEDYITDSDGWCKKPYH
ncbi:hypothetical protein F5887DRAFT_976045 [Amanita rubescens]|nr:hypothetical protein F5887DRAFT_976045 [Amanita rubescens]